MPNNKEIFRQQAIAENACSLVPCGFYFFTGCQALAQKIVIEISLISPENDVMRFAVLDFVF